MKSIFALILFLSLTLGSSSAQSRFVTLTVESWQASPGYRLTNEIAIATNETAEIVSWLDAGGRQSELQIVKDGVVFATYTDLSVWSGTPHKLMVAGPGIIRLKVASSAAGGRGFCTISITPESFPPDKTIILPADTKGAIINLEASGDLINWTNAPAGSYTNLTGNLFFRIRADRIP